jgi:hypothetical protein
MDALEASTKLDETELARERELLYDGMSCMLDPDILEHPGKILPLAISPIVREWCPSDFYAVCTVLALVFPMIGNALLVGSLYVASIRDAFYAYICATEGYKFILTNLRSEIVAVVEDKNEVVLMTLNTPYAVFLDTGASVSVNRDLSLLKDMSNTDRPVKIAGVDACAGGFEVTRKGTFRTVKNVLHSAQAVANILSLSCLRDGGHSVVYSPKLDRFEVQFLGDKKVFFFARFAKGGKRFATI